jgi:hypothetical protein
VELITTFGFEHDDLISASPRISAIFAQIRNGHSEGFQQP